jgi:amino acid permease
MRQSSVHPNLPWWRAIGVMVGAIIGVGVFGLPYAFAQSGYVVGLIALFLIGGLLATLQLMIAEVAIQLPGHRRFVGYVERFLGKRWKRVTAILFSAYAWGAMVAFMILGGTFLHTLVSPLLGGNIFWYQLAMVAVPAFFTWRGIAHLARLELLVVGVLLTLFVSLIIYLAPSIDAGNLLMIHPENWFFPYGVVIFALSGLGAVPEMKDVLGKQAKRLPHAVVIGQAIVVALYALFTLAVVGVSGDATTEEAIKGLAPVLGSSLVVVGSLLGLVAVSSIFSVLAVELQSTFRFDFHLPLRHAWALTLGVPLALFLLGLREFIELIGFLGGAFGGVLGITVVCVYEKMRRSPLCQTHRCLNVPRFVSWTLICAFAFGILQTVFQLF